MIKRKQFVEEDVTAEAVAALLAYDPATGALTWKKFLGGGAPAAGCRAGALHRQTGYIKVRVLGKSRMAHRVAWLLTYGCWPVGFLDHINGQRADNRIANLREASPSLNAQNQRRAQSHNKSTGLLGAHFHRASGRFSSCITAGGRQHHIGLFATPEQAHNAYLEAKRQLHLGGTL